MGYAKICNNGGGGGGSVALNSCAGSCSQSTYSHSITVQLHQNFTLGSNFQFIFGQYSLMASDASAIQCGSLMCSGSSSGGALSGNICWVNQNLVAALEDASTSIDYRNNYIYNASTHTLTITIYPGGSDLGQFTSRLYYWGVINF